MKTEKKVLIISYIFPPLGSGGAHRTVKFVKYLPQFNWRPIVLTVSRDNTFSIDNSLFKDIPQQTQIYRVKYLNPYSLLKAKNRFVLFFYSAIKVLLDFLLLNERFILWLPTAYCSAKKIIKKHNIDLVYSTSAPATNHLIGLLLKKKYNIPWVVDFRDEWTQNPFIHYSTKIHRYIHVWLERNVINKADSIISVTKSIVLNLQKIPREKNSKKFFTIPNGFDQEDITKIKKIYKNNNYFTVTYSGSLYGPQLPLPFLEAVNNLCLAQKIPKDKIIINFIGNIAAFYKNMIKSFIKRLPGIHMSGYIPHDQCLNMLSQSDLLLLIIAKQRGNVSTSLKLFEYLALQKPILALAPADSVGTKIINKTKAGISVDPDNIKLIEEIVLDFFNKWRTGNLSVSPNLEEIYKYERRRLTKELSNIFDEVLRK